MRIISVVPHPDDEVLGAGGTALRLAQAGHEVSILSISRGRKAEIKARAAEAEKAVEVLNGGLDKTIALEFLDPALAISASEGDDLQAAKSRLIEELPGHLQDADLILSPAPEDAHPAHSLIAKAVLKTIKQGSDQTVWMWSLWRDLQRPTLYVPLAREQLWRLRLALNEHLSQTTRNDYRALLSARATAAAVLGSERVFGFGTAQCSDYAELFTELVYQDGCWYWGLARKLDIELPLLVLEQA